MTTKAAFASLLLLSVSPLAHAQALPDMGPIPFARPDAVNSPAAAIDALTNTTAVRPNVMDGQGGPSANERALIAGLDALSLSDPATARTLRNHMKEDSLERRVLTWAMALSASDTFSSGEIAAIARELGDWPGMLTLREHAERALYRENQRPRVVVSLLGDTEPRTLEARWCSPGPMQLWERRRRRARLSPGSGERQSSMRRVKQPFWRHSVICFQGPDHRVRMEQMLYDTRVRSAERVAERAGGAALTKAWAAVIRGDRNAENLLDAVPEAERSAGYIFAKTRFLRRAGRFDEAARLMLTAPRDAESLIDPDEWWVERRVLSRELLDTGDAETAYRVAAAHSAESPSRAADAEFHAGWYALRALKDAQKAAPHFARIAEIAEGPISNARANYCWGGQWKPVLRGCNRLL